MTVYKKKKERKVCGLKHFLSDRSTKQTQFIQTLCLILSPSCLRSYVHKNMLTEDFKAALSLGLTDFSDSFQEYILNIFNVSLTLLFFVWFKDFQHKAKNTKMWGVIRRQNYCWDLFVGLLSRSFTLRGTWFNLVSRCLGIPWLWSVLLIALTSRGHCTAGCGLWLLVPSLMQCNQP